MSTTRILDAEFVHIPPPPTRARPVRNTAGLRRAGHAVLGALGEASLVGMAALAFAWGAAELAFVLLSR
jgi:hypothetical protein